MPLTDTALGTEDLLAQLRDGVWAVDAQWRTVYVNPALCRLLGRDADEILGRRPHDFTTSAGRHQLAQIASRRAAGVSETVEFPYLRGDGRVIWTRVSAQPRFAADGDLVGVLAVVTDITAERALREQQEAFHATLHEQRRQLETILDMLPVAILVTDGEGRTILASAYNKELTGQTAARIDDVFRLVHPDDLVRVEADARRALVHGKRWSGHLRIRRVDGAYTPVHSVVRAALDADGEIEMVFVVTFEVSSPDDGPVRIAAA